MADSVCPPLGTGSVDMNALHNAARNNQDLETALAAATTRVEAPEPAEPEINPEPVPAPEPDPEPEIVAAEPEQPAES